MPLRTIKHVQIQVAVTVAMIIFLHFIQSLPEIFWIHLAHYVTAKNLKNGVSIYLIYRRKGGRDESGISDGSQLENSSFFRRLFFTKDKNDLTGK